LFANEVTPETILELRTGDDLDAADRLDARVRELESQHKRTFVEMGLILNEMSDRTLFIKIVDKVTGQYFTSFDRWLADAAPISRSGGYAAMKAMRELTDVPVAELQEMPRCNVITMTKLSTKARKDPKIIEAAKECSEEDFAKKIEELHPEQHIENKKPMRLKPVKSARQNIDRALKIAMWVWDLKDREAALEAIASYFMDGKCELEQYNELSNSTAYETAKVHGKVPA
jgi:hypothetical protein